MKKATILFPIVLLCAAASAAGDSWRPYAAPCVERENVFAFTAKPAVKMIEKDRYEITFAVKGNCDVTADIIDEKGGIVRHLGAGVLGANAPAPFRKNSLSQKILWNGKDDLGFYHKEPEKLKVRVRLGLKPVFDKRLGGSSPRNLPGYVSGLAVGPDGVIIICRGLWSGFSHATIRKFDREGKYVGVLVPPPSDLPEEKLAGMGYVEYEPGKRAVHGRDVGTSTTKNASYLPDALDPDKLLTVQPVVTGGRFVWANQGFWYASPGSFLHYVYTDGSTDERGVAGIPLAREGALHSDPRLAVSPDGKTIYVAAIVKGKGIGNSFCVYARSLDGNEESRIFAGTPGKPGSDNKHFNGTVGIACDAKGRVYVSDRLNNRIQVFSPDGAYLKTIKFPRPNLICVHPKTDAIYIQHDVAGGTGWLSGGGSKGTLTKLTSFDDPKKEFSVKNFGGLIALDSWSEKPRIWLSGRYAWRGKDIRMDSVTVWEERGNGLEKIIDFDPEPVKEAGKSWFGRWEGIGALMSVRSACDPVREKLYYGHHVFDLKTGAYGGRFEVAGDVGEIAFDKRGYMHGRQYGVGRFCVWRVDPTRASGKPMAQWEEKSDRKTSVTCYPECPYDYGVQKGAPHKAGWVGAIPTKCQPGAKTFQDGFGVNMRGEVVVESNIYYVPKLEEQGWDLANQGIAARKKAGIYVDGGRPTYSSFMRDIKDLEKRGEQTYFLRRMPGIPLHGATFWVYDPTGEGKPASPAIVGDLSNGVQVDEDGCIYFTTRRTRLFGGKEFLGGRAGTFGAPAGDKAKGGVFTGTFVKGRFDRVKVLMDKAVIKLDRKPTRPPEVVASDGRPQAWIEGADWMYAGASPIVSGGCSCYQMRAHLDWYKRSYVPEAYRHSIGILDTNGNIIMHLGRYGTFDDAPGGPKGAKPGGTDIGMVLPRYISGTDDYLCYGDMGEKIVVLKLDYHAGETAAIEVQ